MPLIPIISFDEFVKAVNDAIYANKYFSDDREYRVKVGQIAKEFKEEKWGKRSKDIDSKTREWISDLSNHFGGSWIDVKNLSFQRIMDLMNGKASAIHAHAIHYRLHAELDLPRFARKIDEFAFGGKTFQQSRGQSVFEKKPCEEKRIITPFARILTYPDAYQRGRKEFNDVKSALILPNSSKNAVYVAIFGAGGYGKSYLAQEICDDEGIQASFSGGIYWLQFGLLDNSDESGGVVGLAEAIDRMLAAQYPISERPALAWDDRDSDILKLVDILPSARLLLIADDLWAPKQSSWLSQVPANVSVLMTTRRQSVAKQASHAITIQHLTHDASYRLLTHGMTSITPDQKKRFQEIVKKFRGWPLLLSLANGLFKQMDGDSKARIDRSLSEYEQFLADDQINAWDVEEAGEETDLKRRKLVAFCIETGLKSIAQSNSPEILRKLAVFPNDTDIPFSVATDYLVKIKNQMISRTRCLTLLRFYNDYSFFSSFNESAQSLRLHDEILRYFRACLSEDQSRSQHSELLASMEARCSSGWETLPHYHTYGWTHLLNHLEKANRFDEADDLRTDFHWLKAKLASVGASEMRSSFVRNSGRDDARLVGRAVNLSITELSNRPESLAHQLFGRLGHETNPRLISLTQAARSDRNFWPVPIRPQLPPIGPELLRFAGHCRGLDKADFDPTGCKVATASWDETARLWDAETGAPIGRPLEGHGGPLTWAAFDPSGCRIVTASDDKTARLWDAETGVPIGRPLEGHSDSVNSAAFDPSSCRIVTASDDKTARLWDAKTGVPIGRPLEGHSGSVNSAAFDPSGCRIVTASTDGTARLWNAETGAPIGRRLEGHYDSVNSAAFDPNGCRIVTASDDKTARLWDAETGAPIGRPLEGHSASVNSAAFDPSGCKIVTASADGTARLWDAETGAPIGRPLKGHGDWVRSAIFNQSGRKIVTASKDRTARLWEVGTFAMIDRFVEGHTGAINTINFDWNGCKIVTASTDGTARLWDAEKSEPIGRPLEGHGGSIRSASFNPSGRRIVTASADRTARLWDTESGAPIGRPLEKHTGTVTSAAFDSSGRKIVTASMDGTAQLWDAETGAPIGNPFIGHGKYLESAVFDPNGRKIVITEACKFVAHLWDAEKDVPSYNTLEGHSSFLMSANFDPNGRSIVTASVDRTARLWDAETGAPIGKVLSGHAGAVTRAVFDPNGRKIVTASTDRTARLWEAETGAPIGKPLEGHGDSVTQVVFDPSGRRIVTVSDDKTARLWDAETRECLAIIDFDSAPECVAWRHEYLSIGLRSGLLCIFLTKQYT